ncbi:MAG TPA: nuclear transport factor 2 family protein [Solirubrobacterales bacterium]|nr:nuclear transport factor 2 family protein [Solirubrobacterales bacterium]
MGAEVNATGEDGMEATALARRAMAAVEGKRREEWLGLFAEECQVEDPVGHLPTIHGKAALTQFWDQAIASTSSVEFEITRQWDAGEEAMLLATVSIVGANGVQVSYDGTFNYALDETGRIASLRAFWDFPAVVAAFSA